MKKIILIDGNSLMFRSYYATAYMPNMMKTKDGIYTNALFGFINMTTKLLEKADYAFVSFDAGKQTFRHQKYSGYKQTRKPLPDELRIQIPLIKEFLDIKKVKRLESLEYEADDLLATVATLHYDDFDEILIITGDKDLLQLVDDKVTVGLTKKGVGDLDLYTKDNFKEKMGFEPLQIIEYKGIAGDSSDNLPGVKGIGEKAAIKLLNEYHDIDTIYQNLNKLTPKMQELFLDCQQSAFECRDLATLVRNIDLDTKPSDFLLTPADHNKLIDFYTRMEFNSLIKKITSANSEKIIIQENEILSSDFIDLKGDGYVICEMFGSNYYHGTFLGLGIYCNNKCYFIKENELEKVKSFLENSSYKKYTFDYKMIYFVMQRNSINLRGVCFDLLLNSYLINPGYAHEDFKITVEHFIPTSLDYYEAIYGANTKMAIPDSKVYRNYAISKCRVLSDVKDVVLEKISACNLEMLANEELDLSESLAKMEELGLKIDSDKLKEIGEDFQSKVNTLEQEIIALAGVEFNLNSPKQLGEVLFEKLLLPHGKKNKTGYSTNVDVLEKLAGEYEIVQKILEYRGYTKLISTYVNGLCEVTYDGFIHPLYRQAYTNTGRLSSIAPNIQNMPIRTERGQVIRQVFVSRFDDGLIVSADYSQIELRVLAHMSNDDKMVEAFNNNRDIHSDTAAQIYEVPLEDVTKDMRRTAKAINFGIIYGMSSWGLSESLSISPMEANLFINKYFYNFHKAKMCLDKFVSDATSSGYSQTLFGRRRYIGELQDKNKAIFAFGERSAMNSPIQGTAADIIKIAMNKVQRGIERQGLKAIMIAQVHDELVFDCPKEEVDILKKLVKDIMENAVKLNVLLTVSISSGVNWFETK